jgi:hypothetical protein
VVLDGEFGEPRAVEEEERTSPRFATEITQGAKAGFPRSTKPAADFCQIEFQSRLQSLTSHEPFANINLGCLPTSYQ